MEQINDMLFDRIKVLEMKEFGPIYSVFLEEIILALPLWAAILRSSFNLFPRRRSCS